MVKELLTFAKSEQNTKYKDLARKLGDKNDTL